MAPKVHVAEAARPLLSQHNAAALIQTYDLERVLADIETDNGDRAVEIVGYAVLLVLGAPCQIRGWQGRSTARLIIHGPWRNRQSPPDPNGPWCR